MRTKEVLFYGANRLRVMVEINDPRRYNTCNQLHLPECLFSIFPHLHEHQCHNGQGHTFRQECNQTEVPHLFEHLIIELQNEAQPTVKLCGETQWNWQIDTPGVFFIYVEYDNELLALGAIRLAERLINAIDGGELNGLDVAAERKRLKQLAGLGRKLGTNTSQREIKPTAFTLKV